jgi:hypothetical protein
MQTALEEELSAAFRARATTLPPEAGTRVRSIDYRPRQHGRVLSVGLGAGAAAGAATAGTVLAVVLGGAAPAYAGWSATPTSSAPSTSAPAPDCISTLTNASPGSSGTDSGSGTWQTLLSDVRGPFTITLLQNGTSYATCFTGPSFTEVNRITAPASGSSGGAESGSLSVRSQSANGGPSQPPGGLGSTVSLEGTSSGDLNQILQNHLTTSSDGPYTFIDGRVASGVTGVTLVRTDGQDVVSTVADGWFVAWWPGSTDATSAQVAKASGSTSEAFVPVTTQGMKLPLGQGNSATGVTEPQAGTCTTGTRATSGSSPNVNCQSTTDQSSGNSGAGSGAGVKNAGTGSTGMTGATGNTGPGSSKP